MRILGWTLFAAALGMFVHAQVDVMLRFWAPSAMFWTLIGLMIATARLGCEPASGPGFNERLNRENKSVQRTARDAKTRNLNSRPFRAFAFSWLASSVGGVFIFVATLICVVCLAVGVVWSGARAEWLLGGGGLGKYATPDQVVRNRAEAASLSRYVPDYLIALKERGDALGQEGNLGAAIASYEELERTAPGYGQTREVLGDLYFLRAREIGLRNEDAAKADLAKSAEWLDRAVGQYPYHVGPRLSLARVMFQASRRNLQAAIAQVRAAVEADPNSAEAAEAHFLLGALLAEAEQKEEALAELDKAAALCDPSSGLARRIEAVKEAIGAEPSLAH